MNQRKGHEKAARKPGSLPRPREKREPEWAEGLRQLYHSVVNEPLPDSFDELLKKLGEDGRE